MSTQTTNKPAHEVRLGSIKAAIWRDTNADKTRFNISITRIYKDGDKWKQTEYLNRDDLPKVALVAQKAYEWTFSSATNE